MGTLVTFQELSKAAQLATVGHLSPTRSNKSAYSHHLTHSKL